MLNDVQHRLNDIQSCITSALVDACDICDTVDGIVGGTLQAPQQSDVSAPGETHQPDDNDKEEGEG